jgi:hypothetical protein
MMRILYRKEVYRVVYDTREFARINGKWHIHTGGSELDWDEVSEDKHGISHDELERSFQHAFSNSIEAIKTRYPQVTDVTFIDIPTVNINGRIYVAEVHNESHLLYSQGGHIYVMQDGKTGFSVKPSKNMTLIYMNEILDTSIEHELFAQPEHQYGFTAVIAYRDGRVEQRNNLTEVHHLYKSHTPSIAFESDHHSTGGTKDISVIDTVVVFAASKMEEEYSVMTDNQEKIEYTDMVGEEDDMMTIDEFKQAIQSQAFGPDDGYARPVKDGMISTKLKIFTDTLDMLPKDATHIIWCNK